MPPTPPFSGPPCTLTGASTAFSFLPRWDDFSFFPPRSVLGVFNYVAHYNLSLAFIPPFFFSDTRPPTSPPLLVFPFIFLNLGQVEKSSGPFAMALCLFHESPRLDHPPSLPFLFFHASVPDFFFWGLFRWMGSPFPHFQRWVNFSFPLSGLRCFAPFPPTSRFVSSVPVSFFQDFLSSVNRFCLLFLHSFRFFKTSV